MRKQKVISSTFWMSYIMAKIDFIWLFSWKPPRWNEKITSSIVSLLPLWNLTPSLILIVYLVPFSSIFGRSAARSGSTRPSLVSSYRAGHR